jgi:hypothetical protein
VCTETEERVLGRGEKGNGGRPATTVRHQMAFFGGDMGGLAGILSGTIDVYNYRLLIVVGLQMYITQICSTIGFLLLSLSPENR